VKKISLFATPKFNICFSGLFIAYLIYNFIQNPTTIQENIVPLILGLVVVIAHKYILKTHMQDYVKLELSDNTSLEKFKDTNKIIYVPLALYLILLFVDGALIFALALGILITPEYIERYKKVTEQISS